MLLRRHVSRRAHQRAPRRHLLRCVEIARRAPLDTDGLRAREAEIGHADPPVLAEQDVLRLEVSVHEPGFVRRLEASPRLDQRVQHLANGGAIGLDPLSQRPSLDVLHRDEDAIVDLADLIHGDDVGMGQLGHRLSFADEPIACRTVHDGGIHVPRPTEVNGRLAGAAVEGHRLGIQCASGDLRVDLEVVAAEQLQRHLAIELGIVGQVDDAHAALTEQAQHHVVPDLIAATEHTRRRICERPLGQHIPGRERGSASLPRFPVAPGHSPRRVAQHGRAGNRLAPTPRR